MSDDKETPERRRERLRQEEIKRNPLGGLHGGGLPDLVGGLGWGWKGTGILILVIIIGFIFVSLFFK
ncbi:DUF6366 family protein [Peribacillus sp. NPDC101481]|uniref:DUF6366 family protein n=1 Tax=Bacillaceae TaxID=186817 RepID=UPI000C3332EA|nr:DUF6366 family protein [Bacillus sp. BA3]PKF85564.1 hypothetical protein CW306_27125 [Bacillus sp. BA3]